MRTCASSAGFRSDSMPRGGADSEGVRDAGPYQTLQKCSPGSASSAPSFPSVQHLASTKTIQTNSKIKSNCHSRLKNVLLFFLRHDTSCPEDMSSISEDCGKQNPMTKRLASPAGLAHLRTFAPLSVAFDLGVPRT